jgi:selenide,water dikinase
LHLEVVFDAQTSGGLLISVPAEKSSALLVELRERRTLAAAVIGEVAAKRDCSLLLK